jgi:CBS domain-containing protein
VGAPIEAVVLGAPGGFGGDGEEAPVGGLMDPETSTPHDPIVALLAGQPVSVSEKLTLGALASVLREAAIGAALVSRDDGTAAIVSERDITRALGDGADPDMVWAADIMSEELVEADGQDSILQVAFRMLDEDIRHVVILEDDEVVGLVSARDVFRVLAEDALKRRD